MPTSFIWSLTLLATIGGFLLGYDTANIGSALDFVPYSLTGFALGYPLPGTKAHPVEEITRLFERQATGATGTEVPA